MKARFFNYGQYSSANYGAHTLAFVDGAGNEYYYSYDTLVAFRTSSEFHIIRNYWGSTTGKHLNWINPDKSIREDAETFENNYKRLVKQYDKETA